MADISLNLCASFNKCVAGVELPPGLRFVTCQFCGSRLEVRFSGGVAFTEVLDPGDDGARKIAADLRLIKLQNELSRLDQEWSLEREHYFEDRRMVHAHPPTAGQTNQRILFSIIAIAFGVIWIGVSASQAGAGGAPVFGLLPIVFGIASLFHAGSQRTRYNAALGCYHARRDKLLRALSELESRGWGTDIIPEAPESASP